MKPILCGQTDSGKSERGENDVAISGSVVDSSVHQTLDSRAAERPRARVQHGVFLESISGRDPLRVMRAAKDADDERDPYGWWRK